MDAKLRVLMITSEWPTPDLPHAVPFVVRQVEFLRQAGVQVDVFNFRGGKKLANYWRAWRRAQEQLARNSYDLIHAQWGQSALLALPKRRPLVVTFRGTDLEGIVGKNGRYTFQGRILRTISRRMARLADEVIVVSEPLARHLPARPYHVIPSGLDLELFRPMSRLEARQKLGMTADQRLVLFAAAPGNPIKRYTLAQTAVSKLNGQFNAELVVASGIQHSLMPYYMNACDALLLTSLHEGSPNVVKEALACNLPVVSVDVGDVRQRIGAIEGCVLCPDDCPEAIAEGLAQVLKKNQRVDGRSVVRELDERMLAQRVISIYQQALSRA